MILFAGLDRPGLAGKTPEVATGGGKKNKGGEKNNDFLCFLGWPLFFFPAPRRPGAVKKIKGGKNK